MNILRLILLLVIVSMSSCNNNTSQNRATRHAVSFCEALYNLDYVVAKELSTASSLPYISFMATNTTQEHIEKVKAKGPVDVEVIDSRVDEEGGSAIVVCSIKNSLKTDYYSGISTIIAERRDTIRLVKDGEDWLVRMGNPLQNGMQNPD